MEEKKLNLKPFDIEKVKAGHPVCTRDGRKARIICFDAIGYRQPIVALVTNFDGKEDIETYYLDGRFNDDIADISDYDLMMASEKKTGWINIHPYQCEDKVAMIGYAYKTQKEAEECARDTNCIATIPIEWEE